MAGIKSQAVCSWVLPICFRLDDAGMKPSFFHLPLVVKSHEASYLAGGDAISSQFHGPSRLEKSSQVRSLTVSCLFFPTPHFDFDDFIQSNRLDSQRSFNLIPSYWLGLVGLPGLGREGVVPRNLRDGCFTLGRVRSSQRMLFW